MPVGVLLNFQILNELRIRLIRRSDLVGLKTEVIIVRLQNAVITIAHLAAIEVMRPHQVPVAESLRVGLLADLLDVLLQFEVFFELQHLCLGFVLGIDVDADRAGCCVRYS